MQRAGQRLGLRVDVAAPRMHELHEAVLVLLLVEVLQEGLAVLLARLHPEEHGSEALRRPEHGEVVPEMHHGVAHPERQRLDSDLEAVRAPHLQLRPDQLRQAVRRDLAQDDEDDEGDGFVCDDAQPDGVLADQLCEEEGLVDAGRQVRPEDHVDVPAACEHQRAEEGEDHRGDPVLQEVGLHGHVDVDEQRAEDEDAVDPPRRDQGWEHHQCQARAEKPGAQG